MSISKKKNGKVITPTKQIKSFLLRGINCEIEMNDEKMYEFVALKPKLYRSC